MHTRETFKLFLSYAIPSMIGMLVVGAYNTIDAIFIGHSAGALGLAAVSISWSVAMFVGAIGDMLGAGAAVLISQAKGRGNIRKARSLLGQMLLSQVLLSAFLIPLLLFLLQPILQFLNAEGELLIQAINYGNIAICGGVMTMLMLGTNAAIRNDNRPELAMWLTVGGLALNVILDYIFIFLLDCGIKGAAYATILSETIQTIISVIYFYTPYTQLHLRISLLTTNLFDILKMLYAGLPTLGSHFILISMRICHDYQSLRYGGPLALAAYTFIGNIQSICSLLLSGIAVGIQPLISFWHGTRQHNKQHQLALIAYISVFIIGMLFTTFFILTSAITPTWFNLSDQAAQLATTGLQISSFSLVFWGIIKVATVYDQSTNHILDASLIMYGDAFVVLPLCLFILPLFFDLNGVWMAMPVSRMILCFLIVILWFKNTTKQKGKNLVLHFS